MYDVEFKSYAECLEVKQRKNAYVLYMLSCYKQIESRNIARERAHFDVVCINNK